MKNEIKEKCIQIAWNVRLEMMRGGGRSLRLLFASFVALLCSFSPRMLDVLDDDEMINHCVLLFLAMTDEGRCSSWNGDSLEEEN